MVVVGPNRVKWFEYDGLFFALFLGRIRLLTTIYFLYRCLVLLNRENAGRATLSLIIALFGTG